MPTQPVKVSSKQPSKLLLGLDHLRRIKTDQLSFYRELNENYGDVVHLQLGPYRTWLLFHPDPIEEMLTRKWSSFVRFEKLTNVVKQWNGDSLLLAEGDAWRERRRKVLPAFQTKRLPNYGTAATQHADLLCKKLDAMSDADGSLEVNTDAMMARLTLDIATTTLFGSEPLDNGDEIEEAIQILSETAFRESTSPFTLPDWLPLESKKAKLWAMEVMDKMVTGLVQTRLDDINAGGDKERGDLLSMLVEHHKSDGLAIRNDAMSLLIAGHETSGALLSWVFTCLAENPSILKKLETELANVLNGNLPTFEDLPKLVFLRCVIEETLRLYPPAYALFVRRAVEDVELSSIKIHKNDNVQIVPYTIHRMEKWFERPNQFDPMRFSKKPSWPKYAYLPFGAGPRVCIGQNFGLMEACLATATILQKWQPKSISIQPVPEAKFSLRPRDGLPMMWKKR